MALVETTLVTAAEHEHPAALRRTAQLLLARLDPDGAAPRLDVTERRREVTLARYGDGSGLLRGRLTAQATAVWDAILDSLSAPVPSVDSVPDDRSAAQRRHDALLEAGQRLLRSDVLPAAGGVPVTVLATTTLAELRSGTGVAFTSRGDVWPVAQMARSLSDAEIIPVLLDDVERGTDARFGAVLALGRTRRLASRSQRLALAARDGGCTFPDCERPPSWTEAHHIVAWQEGGSTDLSNLCLVCRFHHREFESRGWCVRITDGVPEWIPPPWLGPAQRPRRNRSHRPPDLLGPDLLGPDLLGPDLLGPDLLGPDPIGAEDGSKTDAAA